MKKKVFAAILAAVGILVGCGIEDELPAPIISTAPIQSETSTGVGTGTATGTGSGAVTATGTATTEPTSTPTPSPTPEPENREGMYRSEITNEWIDESLKNQRPIAVMVDNEKTALPHYGLTQADVVYEMMNSTANNRVTRFMAIVKDWESLTQFGSIRSTRSTNVYLVGEWNAILCHDGGPFYVMGNKKENYTGLIEQKKYCENLSGIFSRVDNGKKSEFTEYIVGDNRSVKTKGQTVAEGIKARGYAREYNQYNLGKHFTFSDEEFTLSDKKGYFKCTEIQLVPFKHNTPTLKYNESTGTYDYSEYGQAHLDPENDNAQLTFENLIIQKCSFSELDKNGYLVYNCIGSGQGYYITNGTAIEITWEKGAEQNDGTGLSLTVFRNKATGEEIILNTGKTYIALVPDDTWNTIVIK